MKEQVLKLKQDKDELEILKKSLKEKKDNFEKEIEGIKTLIKDKETIIDSEISSIQEHCLEEYQKDNTLKEFIGGFKIQQKTKVEYDKLKAVDWCIDNAKACLKIDEKSFKSIAKSQKLDFYKESKEPQVTVPGVIKLED
jgi:hypothetical protein